MRRFYPLIFIDKTYFRKSSVISFPQRIVPHLWWNIMFYIKASIFNSFTLLISLIVNITLVYYTYTMYMEFHISCCSHGICPHLWALSSLVVVWFISNSKMFAWSSTQGWSIRFRFSFIRNCSHSLEVSCNLLLSHQFFEFCSHVLTHQSWVSNLLILSSFDFMLSLKVFFYLTFVIMPDLLIFFKIPKPSFMQSLLHLKCLRETFLTSRLTYRFDLTISLLFNLSLIDFLPFFKIQQRLRKTISCSWSLLIL